jgi:hypothetical protein
MKEMKFIRSVADEELDVQPKAKKADKDVLTVVDAQTTLYCLIKCVYFVIIE